MFGNKLINFLKSEKQVNDKKKIENLVFVVIVLIITIVIINYIWNGKSLEKSKTNTVGKQLASEVNQNNFEVNKQQNNLEIRLESILAKIQGVGNVNVFINYSESTETVPMYNENSKTSTTEETDTSGGVRKIQETNKDKEIVYQEENGDKTPIIQKTVEAKIQGAIITAKGASNATIKNNIIQAVEAATGLATHKIQVFEME